MTNLISITVLLLVSLVALGGLTVMNMQSITGNFQIYQHAPIDTLAAYIMYEGPWYEVPCDEQIADWDARGRPINYPPADVCLD